MPGLEFDEYIYVAVRPEDRSERGTENRQAANVVPPAECRSSGRMDCVY
jgi:hypothetical protein